MLSDDIRHKTREQMRSPDNPHGCILKVVDDFIKSYEEPIQLLKDQFASNREQFLQQANDKLLGTRITAINEANTLLQNRINDLFAKPPETINLTQEDLHYIPHFM